MIEPTPDWTSNRDRTRVAVIDDHPLFRQGISALITDCADTILVGQGGSGEDAIALCTAEPIDVVVMDVHMPGIGGVEAVRRITHTNPSIAVLMLTMMDDDESVFAAMRAGAQGYVLKGADPTEILRAIEAVANGQAIFGTAIARRINRYFTATTTTPTLTQFATLTSREHQILELMATGAANAVIASRLDLSEKTVRNNVSNIFAKLHVADRAAAVARARDAGLGQPSS
jgi:DNA-binding NarL/FixJ family response regulator